MPKERTERRGRLAALAELVHQVEGPLTRDLLRSPGRFGLGQVPARLAPDATTTLVCGFCATGCGLDVHLRDGQAVNLSPAVRHPVNRGMACPKGWEALTPLSAPDRATTPLLRDGSGRQVPISWDEAAAVFAERFGALHDRLGGDGLAFLSTGQICTEEMVFLGAFAKFGLGMHHGDGNTRQCMATAATAYKESFGFDAPPYTYEDFEASDVIVLVGSNLCIAHPILWERICRNPHSPEIVVVDPRRTETAMAASEHLALAPQSDLVLFYAVARLLIERDWIDRDFVARSTEGFEALAAQLEPFTLARAARETGLAPERIERLAETLHRGRRVSFWWTMGVNQGHQAVRVAQSLVNLALLTGSIGRPGTGANSITGQCNAMGSRLFSNTTNLFGGRSFESADDRREVAAILGVPEARIPTTPGLAYDQILAGVDAGRIRGLWVVATNTAHSWIDQNDLDRVLEKLDFLVVQDMYASTETARRADLVLPAAGWGEKEGSFINSERRIGLVKRVSKAPGQALADFQILRLLAEACGCGPWFGRWKTPEDVFDSIRELSRGRPCDVGGIEGYRMIDEHGGIQWPLPEGEAPATERRLFADGRFFRPDGRALLVCDAPAPVPEPTDEEYPLVLLTGRGSSSQWHTQTRTAKSPVLQSLARREAWVEVAPADAAALGIAPESQVTVASRRGEVRVTARVSPAVAPGQVFMPMHFPETNRLTFPAFDPHSRQPAYKHCAVRLVAGSSGPRAKES